MTSVQTSTGTWNVEYNAENRPVRWTNAATGTVITMSFDSQGRRTEYKSVTNGAQNTWLRFLYDGYLCVQVLYSNEPYNVFKEFVWDPTEPVATRPLVFRYAPNSLNLFYVFDGNKNVSDVFYRLTSNGIGAHYDYAPFGATTRTHRDASASFDIVTLNPFRFSSEYYDSELDLVYYNFRHYSPSLGRFLSRDPIEEQGGWNLYAFMGNAVSQNVDSAGMYMFAPGSEVWGARPDSWRNYENQIINRGVSICHKYKQGGKCCENGKLIVDPYPEKARDVCVGFVKLYANAMNAENVLCVAQCLTDQEKQISDKNSDCSSRNVARINAHIDCYVRCKFIPYKWLPDGGPSVGWGMLLPDWVKKNLSGIGYDKQKEKTWF